MFASIAKSGYWLPHIMEGQLKENPQPQPPQPQRPRLTAEEARKRYGIRAAIFLALMLWFGYDGWFNQDPKMLEHTGFNRIGAVLLGIGFTFFSIMAISAHRAVLRGQSQNQPKPQP